MQVIAKIVSLIDTVRYRNWPRRLVLIYIRFVGGFPEIVWRLQRSCKPLQIAVGYSSALGFSLGLVCLQYYGLGNRRQELMS